MSRERLIWVFLASLFVGSFAFWNSSLQIINGSLTGLVAVAAIVFGILGAWMSIIKPVVAKNSIDSEQEKRQTDAALEIAPALKQATYLLAGVVFLKILIPVWDGIGQTIMLIVRTQRPEWSFPAYIEPILLATLGSIIVFLYLLEIFILIVTLLPVLSVERKRQIQELYDSEADDPASRQIRETQ